MTEKEFTKNIIIFYILVILITGVGGIWMSVKYYQASKTIPIPLVITSFIGIIGGITGIVKSVQKWNRGKENPIERFT